MKASSSPFERYCTGAEHVAERMVVEKDNKEYLAEKEDLRERGGTYRAIETNTFQRSLSATPQILGKVPASSYATVLVRFRSLLKVSHYVIDALCSSIMLRTIF